MKDRILIEMNDNLNLNIIKGAMKVLNKSLPSYTISIDKLMEIIEDLTYKANEDEIKLEEYKELYDYKFNSKDLDSYDLNTIKEAINNTENNSLKEEYTIQDLLTLIEDLNTKVEDLKDERDNIWDQAHKGEW